MSAGICVMNRNAIAMAADSAVTVGDHIAIHNSANKLFSLSQLAPVGAIVYADSTFMSIPVEIIIKEYKRAAGRKTLCSLKDYLNDFIIYLENNGSYFRFNLNEKTYVKNVFLKLMNGLNGNYTKYLEEARARKGSDLTDDERACIRKKVLNDTVEFIQSQANLDRTALAEYVKGKYKSFFVDLLTSNHEFKWLNFESIESFVEEICTIFDKKFERNGYVGLAIAGYGDDEIYPSLCHIHLYGVINGKVSYSIEQEASICEETTAYIIPLAQVDVMQTFIFGVNDQLLGYLAQEISQQIAECLEAIDDGLFAIGKKSAVMAQLMGITGNILNHMQEVAARNYLAPIIDSVATLPIEELGLLAESMINITSIRRRVALDSNIGTVGGPIDVSIISKSDGFIWLKRKHYFESKYNPQYFYSHYLIRSEGEPDESFMGVAIE